MAEFTYNNRFENLFWLEIMGNNARIILYALHPDDTAEITSARGFITQFDNLHVRAEQLKTTDQLNQLNKDAFNATQNIRQFFLRILDLQVTQSFRMLLKPLLINHMVDMANEYLRILYAFTHDRLPVFDPIDQDILWMPTFLAQSKYVADNVGFYENDVRRTAEDYASRFQDLYNFSLELKGIRRTGKKDFPIENKHRRDMERILRDYSSFIANVMLTVQRNETPGTMSLEYMDRADRILCYYLKQLSVLSNSIEPECDPSSPRLSNR
jgi:Protein of unknown function (DUF2935).